MQMALVNADGEVKNVIEANPDFIPEEGLALIPATQGITIGAHWDGARFVAPDRVRTVPECVSDLQFRLALNITGLRAQAESLVQNGPQDWRDYWDRSLEIHRAHPLIEQARIALAKSAEEIDDLFRLAAEL